MRMIEEIRQISWKEQHMISHAVETKFLKWWRSNVYKAAHKGKTEYEEYLKITEDLYMRLQKLKAEIIFPTLHSEITEEGFNISYDTLIIGRFNDYRLKIKISW